MGGHGAAPGLRVRFAADPASVPAARRFVTDGLRSWNRAALVDTAALCVSELAGNAALHAGAVFIDISLQRRDRTVRLSVEDDGPVPAEVVAPRWTPGHGDDIADVEALPTTGRGLGIVSVLAEDWGVEPTPGGKRVWVDLTGDERDEATGTPGHGPEVPDIPREVPPGWVLVVLAGCPVRLSLRQDDHLDELVREFQLLASDRHRERSRQIVAQLEDVLSTPAHARYTGRRQALQALAAGHEVVDVRMAMPHEMSTTVQRLDEAVKAADELCEQAELLTLASPPELRTLRAWMTHELVQQIDHGDDPLPWAEYVARQPAT